ncbi:MAG: YbjN domain-containing protein [Bacteroidota bacterium]
MTQLIELIESAIARLGIDPAMARDKKPYTWLLAKGEAHIFVEIITDHPVGRPLFQVRAPMLDWPETNSDSVGKKLLECNRTMIMAAFCLDQGKICLLETRELPGLDEGEALDAILKVGEYAEMLDQWLAEITPERTPIGYKAFSA